jgi:hypothetical protein
METKFIRDLKGNETNALIIGSGSSLDYLPYNEIINIFKKNSVVICMNETYMLKNIYCDYIINHHTVKDLPDIYHERMIKNIYKNPYKFVLSNYDCNNINRGTTYYDGPYYKYDGLAVCETTDVYVKPLIQKMDNYLFVGGTILLDAIGLAFHLGAKNIFMMGIDGGTINGYAHCKEYREISSDDNFSVTGHSHRTMASLQSFMEWAKPKGWNFVNLSQRMGNAFPISRNEEVEYHKQGFTYKVIED